MSNSIFDKVVFVGPDKSSMGQGGISSVMRAYSLYIKPFYYLRTNSAHGTILGLVALMIMMMRLPYYRWFKKVEIAHIHGATGKSFVRKTMIIKWAKVLGFRLIFHCHSGHISDYVNKRGREKVCSVLDECDCVVALSNGWKRYFEEELGCKNVKVINNIVYPVENNLPEFTSEKIRLLFLGLICENKGIFDLLDVLVAHKEEFENKLILYVGGAGDVEYMNSIISKHRLDGIVKYLGWVSGEEKKRVIRDCDVCVLPSYVEGMPITILEAMANSKTVIASNVGGIPEIVKDGVNGLLHTPGDKDAIYRAIKYCLDNPNQLASYGKLGAEIVKDYYPLAVVSQLQELYVQLLTKS